MKKFIIFVAVIFLSVFALIPLFGSAYFPIHDDTQVGRVIGMSRSLLDGQFPVRWVSDLGYGYGYPLFNYYGPLPYYIGGILVNIGFPALYATKIMMGIGMILAPALAFVVLTPFFGVLAASLSSILFMYAPYHAVQLYVRGAVGELYATAFLPLIFYGLLTPLLGKIHHRSIAIGSLGIALTILSHTIIGYVSVVLYSVWVILYTLVSFFGKKKYIPALFSYVCQVLVGLLLSAFFWLPAVFEMGYTSVSSQISGSANFKDHFVCASQFLYSPWGFGGSILGCVDGMSFKIGTMQLALFFYGIFIFWVHRFRPSQKSVAMLVGIVLTWVALFFMSAPSSLIWDRIVNFSYIQYPWRFLSIATFGIAVVCGYAFSNSGSFVRRILAVLIIVLVLVVSSDEFSPQRFVARPLEAYTSKEELHFRVSKISDEYLPRDIIRPQSLSEVKSVVFQAENSVTKDILTDRSNYLKAMIQSSVDQNITVAKTWFVGWHYFVNGNEITPRVVNGFPIIHVLRGSSMIELRLSDTPVQRVGNVISILTVVCAALLFIRYEKNNA